MPVPGNKPRDHSSHHSFNRSERVGTICIKRTGHAHADIHMMVKGRGVHTGCSIPFVLLPVESCRAFFIDRQEVAPSHARISVTDGLKPPPRKKSSYHCYQLLSNYFVLVLPINFPLHPETIIINAFPFDAWWGKYCGRRKGMFIE